MAKRKKNLQLISVVQDHLNYGEEMKLHLCFYNALDFQHLHLYIERESYYLALDKNQDFWWEKGREG